MQELHISDADWDALNHMVGKALLEEPTKLALLKRDQRHRVLRHYRLSKHLVRYIKALADLPDLDCFARIMLDNTICCD